MKNYLIVFVMAMGLLVGFQFGISAQDSPAKMQELQKKIGDSQTLYESKKYAEAIPLMESILKEYPNVPQLVVMLEYNMACSYSRLGKKEEALNHLEKSVSTGIFNLDHMAKDEDLDAVRKMPRYSEICANAQKMIDDQQKALAKVPEPQDVVLTVKDLKQGEKSPLLIFLHGMGGSPSELKSIFEPLTTTWKYTVFLPSGSVKMGIRPDGKPAYNWDPNKDVKAIVEKIRRMPNVDLKKVYLGGFSAGANMTYIIALDSPEVFAGVIAFSGMMQKEFMTDDKVKKAAGKVPLYLVHGKQDEMMPISLGRDARDYFKKNGFRVTLMEFEGGHTLPANYPDVLKEAILWFHTEPTTK